jgi:hypothetical protein
MYKVGDNIKIISMNKLTPDLNFNLIGYEGTIVEPCLGYEDDAEYGDYDRRPYWVEVEADGCILQVEILQKDMEKV